MKYIYPIITLIVSFLMSQCVSTAPIQNQRYGYTNQQIQQNDTIEYLAEVKPGGVKPTIVQQPAQPIDTVSYWDGDNVWGTPSVTLDLSDQKAYFKKGGKLVGVSKISSGNKENKTPTGTFKITQKHKDHFSNLYGDYIDKNKNILKKEIDVRIDKKPPGAIFDGAEMKYFMRFNGGIGMHAGFLPGFPASHGCVRLPEPLAKAFYENVALGTTVLVRE